MKGFEAIPELLRRHGLDTVFGVLGSSNVQWIGAGVQAGALRLVKTRHEETAVSAASAFSRVTGRIGVCSATRGPGFANSINPLISSVHYHAPLLMIVGESPASRDRTSQNIDQKTLTETIGAGFHHVADGSELASALASALTSIRWNGCPQVLSIGDGVLEAEIILGPDAEADVEPTRPGASAASVAAAVDALKGSVRPLILAGQGALLADCRDELETLAALIGARVGSTINVNRFFSGHPHDVGLVGQSAPALSKRVQRETDVVLSVGASLNSFTLAKGKLFGSATIIQCEVDPSVARKASSDQLFLAGDCKATIAAIIEEWRKRDLGSRPVSGATPTFEDLARATLAAEIGTDPARGLDLRVVYDTVSKKLPADRIVVTDAGRTRSTMAALVDTRDARSWLDSRGYGSVGLGLGWAIGAAVAAPGRPVVLFTGDCGFMMSSHDLDAMRLNGLDLTIVIRNDEQYGAERKYLDAVGLPPDIARQTLPDVQHLAQAFGGRAAVVRSVAELEALDFDNHGLFIVDARLDPEVDWRPALDTLG